MNLIIIFFVEIIFRVHKIFLFYGLTFILVSEDVKRAPDRILVGKKKTLFIH